jgi:hypothetical protein
MTEKTYEIRIRVTADGARAEVAGVRSELGRVRDETKGVAGGFEGIQRHLGGMFERVSAIGRQLTMWGALGTAGLIGAIAYAGKYSEKLKIMEAGLLGVYGSSEKTRAALDAVSKLATQGPFGLIDVQGLATGALMAGDLGKYLSEDTKRLEDFVLLTEDIAAGLAPRFGGDLAQSLSTVGRYLPGIILGGPIGELGEKTKGLIDWDAIRKEGGGTIEGMLTALRAKLPAAWQGMTERLGGTWQAKWSNLLGMLQIKLAEAVGPLMDNIIKFIDELTKAGAVEFLADVFKQIADYTAQIFTFLKPMILKLLEFAAHSEGLKKVFAGFLMLGPVLLIVAGALLQIMGALGGVIMGIAALAASPAMLSALGIILAVIVQLVLYLASAIAVVVVWWKALHGHGQKLIEFFKPALEFIIGLFLIIGDVVGAVFGKIGSWINVLAGEFRKIAQAILEFVIRPIEWLFDLLGKLWDAIPEDSPLKKAMKDIGEWVEGVRERGAVAMGHKGAAQAKGAAAAVPGVGFGAEGGMPALPAGLAGAAGGPVAGPAVKAAGGKTINVKVDTINIKADKVDDKALLNILGKVVASEAPA